MSFCIELFCVVTLQYQILVIIAIAYFIIEKKKTAPQPWQAIAQRFCSIGICGGKPDERKELSNSLRNDSLLDKLVDELAKGKAMEKIKRTNK